ncbi:MAG TPA: hypothetical protein PK156_45495 [Polyangium sp.]|nr:hypothetical protein [Polyangium sp.]
MFDLSWPNEAGQETDPFISAPRKRRRSNALKLSTDEAKAVRIALRKLRRAFGTFNALAVMTGIPSNTLRRVANPNGIPPTGTFAIRLAAAAKVPVEVLLGGKVVVTTPIIGRAA